MPTAKPRIQITVDDELAAALTSAGGDGSSRSRLVRDLAIRGAREVARDRASTETAKSTLLAIADGAIDISFAEPDRMHAERGNRLP